MATISIYPNKKSWAGSPGTEWNRSSVGSSIKQAFSNTIKSTGTLKDSLASLKKQIDSVSSLVDVEDSSANLQAAKEREETKVGALSLAYDKIEEYMAKVERVDQDAQSEIRRLKENFYKRYYYLKPDCEKTKKELAKDWVKGKIEAFGEWIANIGEAIKNIVVGIVDWVKKNWKELVIGLAVIVVGAIITVLLSPAAGAVFWQAVGATIFKGLIVAGISAAVSGTISFGVTLYQAKKAGLGTKEAFGYAAQAFGDGLAHGFMTGAFSFAIGSLVNIGAQAFMGKSMLQSSSLFGSIGKGAMYGAVTEGTTSTVVTALEYFVENGTLEGGFEVIFQSMISGIISGTITGGIMGGKQFEMANKNLIPIDKAKGVMYDKSSDITKEIRESKPLNSPDIDKWYGKKGKISIDENQVWTYYDWEGNAVSYPEGYPDFKTAGLVRQEARIGPFVDRNTDFVTARDMGYIKSADSSWHHHVDGETLQEVETILHDRFRHRGGISIIKKK